MGQFIHNSITFHYEVKGEGLPFIFLHGLGNDHTHAFNTMEIRDGVQLISLDQHGHGTSGYDWDHMNFDTMADDVVALADHLGLERFLVGGISMGAGVSVNLATRYPKRLLGAVLIRPAWMDGPMDPDFIRWFAKAYEYINQEDGLRKYQQDPLVQRVCADWGLPDNGNGYFESESCHRMNKKFLIMPPSQPIAHRDQLAQIDLPVLVISCHDDPIHPFAYGQWYADQIPGAQFVEVPAKAVDAQGYRDQLNGSIYGWLDTCKVKINEK